MQVRQVESPRAISMEYPRGQAVNCKLKACIHGFTIQDDRVTPHFMHVGSPVRTDTSGMTF